MGIKYDELVLQAADNGIETSRYKINRFHICVGAEEMSVMLIVHEIMPEDYLESLDRLHAHVFFKLITDEKRKVIEIHRKSKLFFPSIRITPLPPSD